MLGFKIEQFVVLDKFSPYLKAEFAQEEKEGGERGGRARQRHEGQ